MPVATRGEAHLSASTAMEQEQSQYVFNGTPLAHSHIQNMSSNISNINNLTCSLKPTGDDDSVVDSIQGLLDKINATAALAQKELTAYAEYKARVLKPTVSSAVKVAQVLDIPELVEHILTYLGTRDLLSAMLVNKAIAASIDSSPRIQRALGFLVSSDGFWYSPFARGQFRTFVCDSQGLSSSWSGAYEAGWRMIDIEASAQVQYTGWGPNFKLPNIGSRCRKMRICSPPICKMAISLRCYGYGDDTGGGPGHVSDSIEPLLNEDGLTVGDLLHATVRLREGHRLCCRAEPAVTFRATVRVSDIDPLAAPINAAEEAAKLAEELRGWSHWSPGSDVAHDDDALSETTSDSEDAEQIDHSDSDGIDGKSVPEGNEA